MKLHQVLTGACNAGDRCFAVGSVEGIPFVTYAAGSNIVVLSVTFERVQIIPGICHQNVQISCIDCSTDTGKIAAAYGNKVKVFEPTPLVHHNSTHKLDYHWVETGNIQTEYFVRAISWNLEGTRLLLAGRLLQLWATKGTKESQEDIYSKNLPRSATFQLGAGNDGDSDDEDIEVEAKGSSTNKSPQTGDASDSYELAWETRTATPVRLMSFSPDGTLFATAGMNDPLVKVWYQDKPLLFPSKSMEHLAAPSPTCMDNSTKYAFEYLAHPASVVSIEWRRTSKYMPRGSVANMLVTSCEDSICRLWVETVLPEDGLVNMNNFDPLAAQNPRFRTHRHKHKFMQRLKHMRHCFQLKRLLKQENGGKSPKKGNKSMTIPTLFSTYSVHDYHSYGIHGTGQANGLHFHLAATINAQTDIPLVPSLGGTASDKGFVVHWLNNKEMHFSLQAEYILQELSKKAVGREESFQNGVGVVESEDDRGEDPDPETDFLKRKKLRATTGDLAKFLRTEQDSARNADLPSPHMLHPDQMMSNTASLYSINTDITGVTGFGVPLGDALDHRIETLLKDWHHSPDLLYAVHPLDGSYLVWLVDWLDEYNPGSFRQAQVSFSSRLPNAVPLGDASTLSTHLALFNPFHILDLRNLLHLEGPHSLQSPQPVAATSAPDDDADDESQSVNHVSSSSGPAHQSAAGPSVASEEKPDTNPFHASSSPVVAMVTKHANGTLNLWHLALSDQSKFTQVLSVSHMTRISGHRFRVNSISCHPVLPLLLTTSHHNVINNPNDREVYGSTTQKHRRESGQANQGYCSELILWKVETVGPLGKSGGVKELARINSPEMSAFASVAWIPTVLPSCSLGGFSNSASACFVASDGLSLRIYQAVIDARTLLAQILITPTLGPNNPFNTSFDKETPPRQVMLGNRTPVRIVSEQSTSRPGCILELDAMVEADHDWKQTQFLHVFQQQLLTGYKLINNIATPSNVAVADQTVPEVVPTSQRKVPLSQMPLTSRMSLMEVTQSAVVDLQESLAFSEPFYVVVVEKENEPEQKQNESLDFLDVPSHAAQNDVSEGATVVHVWKLVISSSNEDQIGMASPLQKRPPGPNVTMKTIKMCTQRLPLPDGVGIIHAAPAAGHLSSASIYPACFAPYALVTACTDNTVRFWRCKLVTTENKLKESKEEYLRWEEWQMISKEGTSLLSISGRPLSVSVAYSGRIAVAYKNGKSFKGKFIRNSKKEEADTRYFDLVVSIYECESTGGSEWVQEDVIYLKNIRLPRLPAIDPNIDLAYLHEEGDHWLKKRQVGIETLTKNLSHSDLESQDNDGGCYERIQPKIQGLLSVPSYATILTLKKSIEHRGNVCPLTQKNLVQLDWVSKEDGSHILTVGVGHRVLLYTSVSSPAVKERFNNSKIVKNPKLARQTSQTSTFNQEDVTVRWLRLRSLELRTADGLPPLPMHLSWVRDGIFVVGMDNEMQIFSQWKDTLSGITTESNGNLVTSPISLQENLGEESGTDMESDTDGSVGYDDVGEDRDVLDRELHTLAKEGRITYAPSMSQLPRASSMHALAAAQGSSHTKKVTIRTPKKKLDEKAQTVASPTVSLLQDCLPSYGLFEASQIACPVLPQYHPQQLMELLNSGKIRWVKAILAHLVRCIAGHRGTDSDDEDDEDVEESAKHWARTRTLSISSPDNESRKITADLHISSVPKELTLDYTEISAVPPLPLWLLLAADQGSANLGDSTASGADSLFHPSLETHAEEEEDLDTILSESPPKRKNKRKNANGDSGAQHLQQQYFQFGTRQAALLTSVLTHTQLPGLSSVDQMHLLALADTLASCSATHLVTSTIHSAASKNLAKSGPTHSGSESSLDSCGLRFLLAARHHSYLLRFLPPVQRAALMKQGISSSLLTWAFHSEAQDELLQLLPAFTKPNPTWADYRELGFGWWMRNNTSLRRCIEKLAKSAYQSQGDPLDAAIYYLAMKKKNLVWGLFRQVQNERMTAFFSNNFTEERWRKAALKNAYALLGKQRFDHAVAFFLLAGSLKDAIDICLSRMQDIQLAIVITRLFEGDMESVPPGLKKLLQDHVLGYNESSEPIAASAGSDPFLRSMSYWLLAQYTDSLSTLLERRGEKGELTKSQNIASPSVFNFYIYLRNHPLIIRQQLALSAKGQSTNKRTHLAGVGAISVDKTYLLQEWITPLERRLYFTTAHAHFLAGCPALALEVLSKLPDHVQQPESESDKNSEAGEENEPEVILQKSENVDWSTPMVIVSPSVENQGFDWGQPINGKSDTLELKWSDDEASDSECSDGGITMRDMSVAPEEVIQVTPSEPKLEAEPDSGGLDIMAQQLKFIACLKILMGEMATLATGFEVDGGQLRLQLYLWLDRELQALQQLCNYAPIPVSGSGIEEDEPSLLPAIPSSYKQPIPADEPVTLHEILLAEKLDLEAKVKRTNRRRRWLKANELLVRTLLSYCSVHGSQGGGLASVRMELILLLQELQQDRRFTAGGSESTGNLNQSQLSSPLAYPTSLPLLAASVAGTEIITTDPVRHLESQIRDLLRAIIGLSCVPVPGKISFGQMCLIRDLALALSACLYQALCSSDAWSLQQQQQEQQGSVGPLARLAVVFRAMHNIGVSNYSKREETQLEPGSSPSKWPGVTSLRALLAREKDEDAPRLLTLLCEAFVAIYTSLLCYSMAACDSHVLYRLAGLQPTESMWGSIYGGGAKQLVRVTTTTTSTLQGSQGQGTSSDGGSPQPPGSPSSTMDVAKQRVRLHIKLLQQIGSPAAVGGGMTTAASSASITSSASRKPSLPQGNEDMPTYKEIFVAPKLSLVACLMKKPVLPTEKVSYDYDSSASDAGDEVDAEDDGDNESDNDDFWEELDSAKRAASKKASANPGDSEHSKADSISWHAIRLAVTRLCIGQMEEFLRVAGIEPTDLPVVSPLSHAIARTMHQWCAWLQRRLEAAGPTPLNFIPGCVVENTTTGPPILKYRSLLDPNNTPFSTKEANAKPIRRLWSFLVRQEKVQDIFIRLVFGKKHAPHSSGTNNADSISLYSDVAGQDEMTSDTITAISGGGAERLQDPVRIIHKDQDIISAFCINSTNGGILALANGKEIQELDITPLLDMQSSVLEDECELDLLGLDRDPDSNASSFLVVQTPGDRHLLNQLNGGMSGSSSTAHFPSYAPSASNSMVPPGGPTLPVTGRGTTLPKGLTFPGSQHPPFFQLVLRRSKLLLTPLRKHKVDGVRRMTAHPLLPLYIAGQGDGSVSIWEWGHVGVVCQPRTPGTYAKVNRLRFNSQGNKFGAADGDGHVALWTLRLGGGSAPHRPFFSHQCHSKGTSDFVFLGSSSILATTGHSSESRNVVLWDTLMPQRKAVIHSFVCHENGGTSLLYASQHQLLISAGRKGIVCLWDLRQRTLRHKFTAHDSSVAVKCMALDPNEEFFATGSADGDIKVWSLATQHLLYAFPAEHSRSSFFRSMGQGNGVNQLHLDTSGRLFSCGSDGSMKLRQLPYVGSRETAVSTLY